MLGTVYQNSIFDELRNQGYKDPLIFQEKHSKNQARCRFVIMACRHTLHEVDTKRLKSYVCIIADSCSMSGTLHQFIRAEQYWFAAHDSKHIDIIFGLQCLKPSVYDCVAGRIPVTERLNQHSLQMPVRQPTLFLFAPVTSSCLCGSSRMRTGHTDCSQKVIRTDRTGLRRRDASAGIQKLRQ